MNLNFYDNLGYSYTAKFALKTVNAATGNYTVELKSILDPSNKDILANYIATGKPVSDLFGATGTNTPQVYNTLNTEWTPDGSNGTYYAFKNGSGTDYYINSADTDGKVYTYNGTTFTATNAVSVADIYSGFQPGEKISSINASTTPIAITATPVNFGLQYSSNDGSFVSVNGNKNGLASLNMSVLGGQFSNISIDFTQSKNSDNSGKSTISMDKGAKDGVTGLGKKLGALTGISVDTSGKIFGSYDNGNTVLLGQIAAAQFANASGLEKVGENCYSTTLNSGGFDGIGVEISADGSKMTTGQLEMSNVDLSSEFTEMITTQRGFQANSRVITTSDTLLEELINLKR